MQGFGVLLASLAIITLVMPAYRDLWTALALCLMAVLLLVLGRSKPNNSQGPAQGGAQPQGPGIWQAIRESGAELIQRHPVPFWSAIALLILFGCSWWVHGSAQPAIRLLIALAIGAGIWLFREPLMRLAGAAIGLLRFGLWAGFVIFFLALAVICLLWLMVFHPILAFLS